MEKESDEEAKERRGGKECKGGERGSSTISR